MKTNKILHIAIVLCALALNLFFVQASKAGTFTATGSMNTGRVWHTATLLQNGQVLVAGGTPDGSSGTASSELYDPNTGTWTNTGSMSEGRVIFTATLLTNGTVLAFGTDASFGVFTGPLFEIYNPTNGMWTAYYYTNYTIGRHTATLLPNGEVLIAGGINDIIAGTSSGAQLFDPSTGLLTPTGSMTTPRYWHVAVLLTNGLVLVAGGGNTSGALSSAELYNPATGTWTNTGAMNVARLTQPTGTLLPNGKVLVTGGTEGENGGEIYDPSNGVWTLTTGEFDGHYNTATLLPNGRVLVAGGSVSGGYPVADTVGYDPITGENKRTGEMTEGRNTQTATLLTNGQVLLAGGGYPNNNSAELYNPNGGLPVVMQNITRAASGAFQFSFTNTPSLNFGVLASTNLSIPIANWPEIAIISDSGIGQYQFSDIQATNYPSRFYVLNPP